MAEEKKEVKEEKKLELATELVNFRKGQVFPMEMVLQSIRLL